MSSNRFTQDEMTFLQGHYISHGAKYVALHLNRTLASIRCKAKNLKACAPKTGLRRKSMHYAYRGYKDISATFISRIKRTAKKRGLVFELSIEYLWDLFEKQQHKCRLSCLSLTFSSLVDKNDGTASLDRIDSNKGYVEGNIQWVHKDINMMKQDHTDADFIALCKAVASCQP